MPESRSIVVAVANLTVRQQVQAALALIGQPSVLADETKPTAAGLLAHEPMAVLFDLGWAHSLAETERRLLLKAGVELLLLFNAGETGRLVPELGQDMVDLVRMPIDVEHLRLQLKRAQEVSRLRSELAQVRTSTARDQDQFEAALARRTDQFVNAENRAFKASNRLSDLERIKSNLITIISHEFKTPIHLASGYLAILSDESGGTLSPDQRAAIEVIQRQFKRISDKLHDIERIAQLEMGLPQNLTESVDIGVLLRQEIEGFGDAVRKKELALAVVIDRFVPPVRGCRDFLSDVFRRLIDNAVHYTNRGGNVTIRASVGKDAAQRSGVLVSVEDTGCGIPVELQPHIFERFGEFRDIEHHSSRRSGLGLGLAICRHLVEIHDGIITVESAVGKGSSFRVFLPRAEG